MKHYLFLTLLSMLPVLAFAQTSPFPNSPNKMRLGYQTSGAGLVHTTDSMPGYTPVDRNAPVLHMDSTAGVLYFWKGGVWNAAAGADGNGIFSVGNNGDTVRVSFAVVPNGPGFAIRDVTSDVVFAINDNSVTATAGDASMQAVKSLGYLLLQGDSLLISSAGSFGTTGQVLTASGNGGAFWDDPPGAGSGEVNTASNLGAGTGLFAGKVGVDLQFKGLAVGPNLSVSSNSTTVTISQTYAYYTNDASAASGGVAIGSVYRVDIGNPYGMTWGTLKTRNE
jgi:hypothetical protein